MMGTQLTGVFLHIACGSPTFATCPLSLNLCTGFLSFIHSHGSTARCLTCAFDVIMSLLHSKPFPLGYVAQSLVGFSKHQPSSGVTFDYEFNDSLLNTKWHKFLFFLFPCKSYTMNSDCLYYLIIEFACFVPTNKPLGTLSSLQCPGGRTLKQDLGEKRQNEAFLLWVLPLSMLGFSEKNLFL